MHCFLVLGVEEFPPYTHMCKNARLHVCMHRHTNTYTLRLLYQTHISVYDSQMLFTAEPSRVL